MLFRVVAEGELVVSLELSYLFQAFALYKLADGPAVGDFEEVGLEVVVSEAEVEELFWVFLHLFEFQLNKLLKVFADVWAEPYGGCVWHHFDVVLNLIFFVLFEESDGELFPLLHIALL